MNYLACQLIGLHVRTRRLCGHDIIPDLSDDEKIKMKVTNHNGIEIFEEPKPIEARKQKLKTDDIIKELDDIPGDIQKYISKIVLNPYPYRYNSWLNEKLQTKDYEAFAYSYVEIGKIIFWVVARPRFVCLNSLIDDLTLAHETGHIFDWVFRQTDDFFSHSNKWKTAKSQDAEKKRNNPFYPDEWVSLHAKMTLSCREDFADSFKLFIYSERKHELKRYYPKRYAALEEIFNDHKGRQGIDAEWRRSLEMHI